MKAKNHHPSNMARGLSVLILLLSLGVGARWLRADAAADQEAAQKILSDLHHANQVEIDLGRLARSKGSEDQIRLYGDMVVKDDEHADRQVEDLAHKDGITLIDPTKSGFIARLAASNDEGLKSDLEKRSGPDFDQAFAAAMIQDHERDIKKLQDAKKSVKQEDVRQLIVAMLPTLQKHLEQAEHLQRNG